MRSKYIFTLGLPTEIYFQCLIWLVIGFFFKSIAKNEMKWLFFLYGVHFKNNVFSVNGCLFICILISNMWFNYLKICKYFKVFVKNLLVFVLLFYVQEYSSKWKFSPNLYLLTESLCHVLGIILSWFSWKIHQGFLVSY